MKKDSDYVLDDQTPPSKKKQSLDMKKMIYNRLEARRNTNQQPSTNEENIQTAVSVESRSQGKDNIKNERYFKSLKREKLSKPNLSQKNPPSKRSNDEEKYSSPDDPLIEIVQNQTQKLNKKLDVIGDKLKSIRDNLQKKRQEQERKKNQAESKKKIKSNSSNRRPSLKNLVTQVPQHQNLHAFSKNPYSPHHNIYYVSEIVRAYKDERSLAREHLLTTMQIMAYFERCPKPKDSEFTERALTLPRKQGYEDKKTVVFDLDQTLIHCNENLDAPYDVKLPIIFPTGEVIEAGINIRPHAKEILRNLAKKFEVIVFTASHSCYANVVLDFLDPDNLYIHHRLFREHCYATPEGMHIKDLRIMDRDLSKVVLVDNAAYSYIHQLENGIPIIPYYHGQQDFELKALEKYLDSLLFVDDVRSTNKKTFKLHQYYHYFHDLVDLVEKLYLVEHN